MRCYNEAERQESPEDDNYYNQSGIVLPAELKDEIYTKIYDLLKEHKVLVSRTMPEIDGETGDVIKEAEDIYGIPFGEMVDC